MPGPHTSTRPGTGPDIEEVRGPLEDSRHLRLALDLDLLEEILPMRYSSDGLLAELWALREKVAAAELAQLRTLGSANTSSSSHSSPPPQIR